MDALDASILQQLGVEPFAGFDHRPRGLRASEVARALGRNARLVQDRIARMEQEGVITGYAMVPNPRHLGLSLTTAFVPTLDAADQEALGKFTDLDGFVQVIAYLSGGVCLSLSHSSPAERDRRLQLAASLAGAGEARPMYEHGLPPVTRPLTELDWRIVAAFAADAKQSVADAAEEIGVSPKTVRNRVRRMREEGSIDEVAKLDFMQMQGVMPFEIAVWTRDAAAALPGLMKRLSDNYWGHFMGPSGGYCDLLFRVFTTTPAEAQALVTRAQAAAGVTRAEPLMAAGALDDPRWLVEAIAARVA